MPDQFLTGNEAVAQAALDGAVSLGTGYPGTPSTEILERFDTLGGRAQWAPNEKVALEVGLGVAYGTARALVTMKHVGLNVAADALFSATYTGVAEGLVIVVADDPGMHSSQNEQDTRRYAEASGAPMFEPGDSQEAYDHTLKALEVSARFQLPVILRMTTRVCHSKGRVRTRNERAQVPAPRYERDIPGRVMIPGYARPAHVRLRERLASLARSEVPAQLLIEEGDDTRLGIIADGVAAAHAREAAPGARLLKPGLTHPLPIEAMRDFAAKVDRCVVIEEGDPYLYTAARAADIPVEGKPERFRFGELNADRVRRILAGDESPEPEPEAPGKPPRLCADCSHRQVFQTLAKHECIVAGDIGCYTLGVMPPFEAMDTCVCMGASIGVGLGLRHALPADQARRVVSVIGDSTFVHTGLPGLAEMAYNPPATGHILLILDNDTTAMTGLQEHPGTGRRLDHHPASSKLHYEAIALALGISNVHTVDPVEAQDEFERLLTDALASDELTLIVARRPCPLASRRLAAFQAEQESSS
ncbi:thiamine pyrophosphate-dependent enzyme [Halorhodospira halophila]|uniref:Indolepyruvate oxidoreductase subunit IorA n=1 Tax=Halorhodospira halophila (strain DSM 244 / SL1) TaxID=349124 RepID=A1WT51_HALHL|nr:thiamine pyrophosphate-dependent enzyme [Halorhodospira halophila]ABM60863.1 Indolepyruvate ferredoxin oxidoreductase [Halorhodospira halophila SL1]MBK1728518.1 thiamine pyrophosphate-binding protein [Halorhodospira halophila]